NRPWVCVFKPVFLHQNSKEIFGYVGLKVDFLAALAELNLFSHLDISSISITLPASTRVSAGNIINHVHGEELHYKELDQLKNVIYRTFAYIVALVLVILFVLYWLVMAFFAKPLITLNRHIESIKHFPNNNSLPDDTLYSSVNEINNFARSLQDYQQRLNLTQENLQNLNNHLEQRVNDRTAELQTINQELEAFSYSVSHDLRAPLRSIDGFSLALLEDNAEQLDEEGKNNLRRVRENTQRMAMLIDDLLNIARISRVEMQQTLVNLSDIARRKIQQLKEQQPELAVRIIVAENIYAEGDEPLLTILMNNLLDNAWKYSSKSPDPVIEFGRTEQEGDAIFYVKDNGTGFDMKYASKIFEVFQRLHSADYEGTGIGLATVSRIVQRHDGRIWAEAEPDKGACFYFTLGKR
ncbi:sensor histidine kinase, partial [Kaarinaea lacus]